MRSFIAARSSSVNPLNFLLTAVGALGGFLALRLHARAQVARTFETLPKRFGQSEATDRLELAEGDMRELEGEDSRVPHVRGRRWFGIGDLAERLLLRHGDLPSFIPARINNG